MQQEPLPLGPVELGELEDLDKRGHNSPMRNAPMPRLLEFGLAEKHPDQELWRITELGMRIAALVRRGAKQHGIYFIRIGKRPS